MPDRPHQFNLPRASGTQARLVVAALLVALATACTSVGGGRPDAATPVAAEPAISDGSASAAADSAAAALIRSAEDALAEGRVAEAIQDASHVIDRYPSAAGSSRALAVLARASNADGAYQQALAAADRYAALFPPSDARAAEAALLAASALRGQGRPEAAARRLLAVQEASVPAIEAEAIRLIRDLATAVPTDSLVALLAQLSPRALTAPLLAEGALAYHFRGDEERARALAQQVQGLALGGPEAEIARAVLDGRVDQLPGVFPVVGAMLAETGSPGIQQFSSQIREGIDVALEVHADQARRPVRLAVMDDQGSPAAADAVVRRLEEQGALAVVGPLLNASLDVAAPARTRGTVLISPTSRRLPPAGGGVYSLAGPDPGAPRALAEYARDQRYERVVVLRPTSEAAIEEARVFRETLEAFGLGVSREIAYDSGSTFFQESLREVARIRPQALVLPIPASDVELLAPQITFFGLDTLGIQVLGTTGWTSESVVENVDSRHTAGVVAAAVAVPGRPLPGRERFVREYESRLRRTLRSPVPALGYDAVGLILEALRTSGARTPSDLQRAFERIEAFAGATGTLSVQDGRIVRAHQLVRFDESGTPTPLPAEGPGG